MSAREEAYGERAAVRPGTMRVIAELAEKTSGVRRKRRTADQRAMLVAMAVSAHRQRMDSGRLVRLGPRRYELRP